MRRAFAIVILLVISAAIAVIVAGWAMREEPEHIPFLDTSLPQDEVRNTPVSIVAEDLTVPWDIAFLPGEEGMLVTERGGRIVHIESGQVFPVEGIAAKGEAGLLGMALHPDFAANRFVYVYQTTEEGGVLSNRVVRYRYVDDTLAFDRVIVSGLPGAQYHDGGRIEFGPDGLLYVTTGDAGNEAAAQDLGSLAGKILRYVDDGSVPAGNPFGTAVYSYGHRNPQGLAWDADGRLWSTEHGRSGLRSGYDEVNRIQVGANYGWPASEGETVVEGTVGPVRHSGADDTWAPASAAFLSHAGIGPSGRLFFGGLRGEALYEAQLSGSDIIGFTEQSVRERPRTTLEPSRS